MVCRTSACGMLESPGKYNDFCELWLILAWNYKVCSSSCSSGCFFGYKSMSPRKPIPIRNRAKAASGAPRPKSAPRGSNSTTFAQGKFQVSSRQKMVANPIGEPSVSPLQYSIYEKLLGGWCVLSCKSIQFPKFRVQTWGYAIRYVMVDKSDKFPPPTSLSSFSLVL